MAKKSPGDTQRRKESRPARRSVSASPLSLSVSHLLGNSLTPPTHPLFTVRTASQSELPSLRASQSERQTGRGAEQTNAGSGSADDGRAEG